MKQTRFLQALVMVALFVFSAALAQDETVTNDETQGRLRVNYCVFDGPDVDIFVNGEVAVNGGVPQTNVFALDTPGYLYLAPNTYSLAVVPTGKELSQALMGPVDVTVEAGHRYTVVVLGQADEAKHQPLVIDETAAYQDIGAKPTDAGHITVNNVKGSGGVTFTLGGVVREENVPYGEFQAAFWPTEMYTGLELAILDTTGEVVVRDGFPGEGGSSAGHDYIDCVGGTPGTVEEDWYNRTSFGTSTLSAVDFLKVREGFTTYLNALETAGLTDTLISESPYMLFAPTDQAFAAMPKEELDALMADPEALADLLQAHIAPGYYPPGSLGRGLIDRTVTNLLGEELVLTGGGGEDLAINGATMGPGGDYVMVANGSRVFSVSNLLPQPPQ
jgi:uncharacterized surface protein with fasciclin (FAS1) repeats